jgi:alginate O-acetyltransferase complex protein AlgJ
MSSSTHTLGNDAPGAHRGGPTDPSHDESLRRGILHTDVARPVAVVLACAFLLVIYAVPIAQAIRDKVNGDPPVLLDLFQHAPTRDNLRQLEDDLDKASTARELIRPRLQAALTRYGGYGNTKAVVGRDGWLFYGPGVASVGGPGFLDPEQIGARRKASLDAGDAAVAADPRPAILDFARFLARRGIRLVLFPVPDKASLQPVELHGRARDLAQPPARNADAGRLAAELGAAGVLLFDPSPDVLPAAGARYFLRQDTHWTPAWMEAVATDLARFLIANGVVAAAPADVEARTWRVVAKSVSRVGDITDMLGLPDGQTLLAPETVEIHEVRDAASRPFEANERAGVLLLGDSFTNVFSLDQMGWGASAGLAAHLARALGRDVDVIAQNDAGAHATRRLLANALSDAADGGAAAAAGGAAAAAEGDRLTGKTVVVWELASRELAVGDFKPVAWPAAPTPRAPAARAPGAAGAAEEGAP